jgi:DNA-binding NtrC family response regulator
MSESLPILVVEDEEFLLSFFKSALERSGIKVVGVASLSEALAQLERAEFAGVISDLRLDDGIGGAEIFDWILLNRPELSHCFLFITGNMSDAYATEIRERTGAAFLEKPFRMAALLKSIKKVMSGSQTAHA